MRKYLPVLALVAVIGIGGAVVYVQAGSRDPATEGPQGSTQRVLFQADGISCGGCEAEITGALRANPAVRRVEVDLARRTVAVEYVDGAVDPKVLADTITGVGYPARLVASGPSVRFSGQGATRASGGCGGSCCSGPPPDEGAASRPSRIEGSAKRSKI